MNDVPLTELTAKYPDRVRAILNILVETPYFYRTDNEDLYFFLRRHRSEFACFGETYFGWHLFMDAKCARFYKDQWHNEAVSETNRDMFDFRTRDECLAFMILLEFFEHLLEENAMTVEDAENPRFLFGDLLVYTQRRFVELFPAEAETRYTQEHVRSRILRRILPVLEKYRLLQRLRPPADQDVKESDTIFEAMPALYHYNAGTLSRFVAEAVPGEEERAPEAPRTLLADSPNVGGAATPRPSPVDSPNVGGATTPRPPPVDGSNVGGAATPRPSPVDTPNVGGAATPRPSPVDTPNVGGAATPRPSPVDSPNVGGAATPRPSPVDSPNVGGATTPRPPPADEPAGQDALPSPEGSSPEQVTHD